MQSQKTLGYVRVVVTEKGKVAHICPNTLHHPDPEEQERLNRHVSVEMIDELFKANDEYQRYEDCQVLVLFYENKDGLTITHTVKIQSGFKNFWRERITKKIENDISSLRDEVHIQSRIELWEETYNETFKPTRPVKMNF